MKLLSTYPHGDDYSISVYETGDRRYKAVIRRDDGSRIRTVDGGEHDEMPTMIYDDATEALEEARTMIDGSGMS
jgi:hypothetical protein